MLLSSGIGLTLPNNVFTSPVSLAFATFSQAREVADVVVLIGERQTHPIREGLLLKGFDKEKIIVFNDVRDAYPFISNLALDDEVYALFENDLPDTFNEK